MLYYIIYRMPLWLPPLITAIAVIVWSGLMAKLSFKSKRKVKTINNILTVIAILGILSITVINRSRYNDEVILIPFHSFIEAKVQKEIYRTLIMNMFLFVPLGICLPYSLPKAKSKNIIITVLFALLMSVGIEAFQYAFSCGRCETDDVICNTLGAFVGSLNYLIYYKKQNSSA